MPVEGVELMQSEEVDILFDEGYGKKMTAHIQVHSPVGETRRVNDFHTGQSYCYKRRKILSGFQFWRKKLEKSLEKRFGSACLQ